MKYLATIWIIYLFAWIGNSNVLSGQTIDIYKTHFVLPAFQNEISPFDGEITSDNIALYTSEFDNSDFTILADSLSQYRAANQLSDWLFFQMVRRTANYIFPKKDNYVSYTVLKWYLLYKAGFDVRMATIEGKLLFYSKSLEEIEDIPYFEMGGKKYYCMNRHDYGVIDFENSALLSVPRPITDRNLMPFSYKIASLPAFEKDDFANKLVHFVYDNKFYQFDIPVNTALDTLFVNYPVVNYESYFNIPLSEHTYDMLIPQLRQAIATKDTLAGLEYLMMFTRKAFAYQNDVASPDGKEKRFSPELTLIADKSDCDDRVGLLHFLIKEIYNLPMIVVQYPSHVILGVAIQKPGGIYIHHQNKQFLVCEPTPQKKDYRLGEMDKKYVSQQFEVSYLYSP